MKLIKAEQHIAFWVNNNVNHLNDIKEFLVFCKKAENSRKMHYCSTSYNVEKWDINIFEETDEVPYHFVHDSIFFYGSNSFDKIKVNKLNYNLENRITICREGLCSLKFTKNSLHNISPTVILVKLKKDEQHEKFPYMNILSKINNFINSEEFLSKRNSPWLNPKVTFLLAGSTTYDIDSYINYLRES